MLILIVFTAIAGLLTFIGHAANLINLDAIASKWLSRFAVITLYAGLIWLGLSMIISYLGESPIDAVNGFFLLLFTVISIVKRITSDQPGANHFLFFAYGFLIVIIAWTFIYNAINIPKEVTEAVGNTFKPTFFTDLLRFWHWQ